MQTQLEAFNALVLDLVIHHNVKQSKLIDMMQKVLQNEVKKKPKIKVLYNATYGGYGFCCEFMEYPFHYVTENNENNENNENIYRVTDVAKVEAFGTTCCQNHPVLAKMLRVYTGLGLETIVKKIRLCVMDTNYIIALQKVLETVKSDSSQDWGDGSVSSTSIDEISIYELKILANDNITLDKLKHFTKEEIVSKINSFIETLGFTIQETKERCNETLPTCFDYESIVESTGFLFEEEVENRKQAWYDRKKWNERDVMNTGKDDTDDTDDDTDARLTFMDALKTFGETHWRIWKCQCHYDDSTMRYLLQTRDMWKDIDLCDDVNVYTDMGLLCASSAYCKLAIKEIPPVLEWRIGEYDGKENVCLV
jgi:hypothetical protein